jgi:phage replication O-like protein O
MKASPQCEDGYTRIANELLDAMCRLKLSDQLGRVLHAIIRRTYGWNQKSDWISGSQLAEMTGMSRFDVCQALKALRDRHIIMRQGRAISVQKDYTQWIGMAGRCPNRQHDVAQIGNGVARTGNKMLPKQAHTKDTKDTISKDNKDTGGDSVLKDDKPDWLEIAAESAKAQQGKRPWTIPEQAGGADDVGDELVGIFCQYAGLDARTLPPKRAATWRRQFHTILDEWHVTDGKAASALHKLQASFQDDYALYLGRAANNGDTIRVNPGGQI